MRLNGRQRSLLAGFFSNLAIVLTGFSLTDQPLVSLPMTWDLRCGIRGAGAGFLVLGLRIERKRRTT
ncbi:MAG: hypothetical protein AAB368_00205 [bacterium]